MSEPIQAKSSPEVKPWVRRVVEAAGVVLPATPDGEKRLGGWGVEMVKFLRFCKNTPEGTPRLLWACRVGRLAQCGPAQAIATFLPVGISALRDG